MGIAHDYYIHRRIQEMDRRHLRGVTPFCRNVADRQFRIADYAHGAVIEVLAQLLRQRQQSRGWKLEAGSVCRIDDVAVPAELFRHANRDAVRDLRRPVLMQVETDKIVRTDEVALELKERIPFEAIEVVIVRPKSGLKGDDEILARSSGSLKAVNGCDCHRSDAGDGSSGIACYDIVDSFYRVGHSGILADALNELESGDRPGMLGHPHEGIGLLRLLRRRLLCLCCG